jgi:glucosyl-3-phosphoglycerate synthase
MHDRAREWFDLRTSHWQDWPLDRLLEARERIGARISVVIPARNEEHTVGGVVTAIRSALMARAPLIDEIVVIDSDSADETARAAAGAGATVHRARDIAPALGAYPGKGEALWKALLVTQGDLLVFIDADLTHWGTHFVTGLLGPLLADPGVQLVKGFYARLRTGTDGSASTEGGRVTELVARPLLSLWWPELGGVVQPLAGEWAARRGLMESLQIPVGYGVELSTLLDTAAGHGLEAIAQVDLDARAHRHQADHDLALMAAELLLVAERRRGRVPVPRDARPPGTTPPDTTAPDTTPPDTTAPGTTAPGTAAPGTGPPGTGPPGTTAPAATLQQFVRARGRVRPRERPVPVQERPPVATVRETVATVRDTALPGRQGAGSGAAR